ncbi:transglutaminase domain-containing protein [Legionella erythra]|uniref:Transglutaminase-like domain-containing protein n=1 Tax=Legionella erythra TaxID=448 RepID=A0A0W0TJ90_LEGER|nr:transglutaminase domain-containing protein [Legionella erythra]KTC95676.1 hypothetical protein Lery_1971 [Legionella erythra]
MDLTLRLNRQVRLRIFLGLLISLISPVLAGKPETKLYCQYKDAFKQNACMTEHAVQGINHSLSDNLSKDDLDIYRALEAMNLVQTLAGSGRYNYLASTSQGALALSMNEQSQMLKRGYGICGNHQAMFLEIMKLLKVDARPVDFYYIDDQERPCSHAAAEVKIANKWRYVDITWGSIWVKEKNNLSSLLSLEEVLNHEGQVMSGINSWYLHFKYTRFVYDPLEYLQSKHLQILRNKGGLLMVPLINNQVKLDGLPRYIGANSLVTPPLRMKFENLPYPMEAIVDIQRQGGLCKTSFLKTSSGVYPVQIGKTLIKIRPESELAITKANEICYGVIRNIELIPDRDTKIAEAPVEYATLKFIAYLNQRIYGKTMG